MELIQAKTKKIGTGVKIGLNSVIRSEKLQIGNDVIVGDDVQLIGKEIQIGNNCEFQKSVLINSEKISIGEDNLIEQSFFFSGFGTGFEKCPAQVFKTGDNVFLGYQSRITVPFFSVGDFCILHNRLSIWGKSPIKIGHYAWIGQETLINTKKSVTMGNSVRIGTRSQISTHSASGEIIEGSTLYSEKEVVLEDNTWLNGSVIVSPGVRVRSWSVALPGSILTKDTEENHLYAGVPARDITEKLKPYNPTSLNDKFEIMKKLIKEFLVKKPQFTGKVILIENPDSLPDTVPDRDYLIIFKDAQNKFNVKKNSVFDLKTKKYNKVRSEIEIEFIQENEGFNARFLPLSQND